MNLAYFSIWTTQQSHSVRTTRRGETHLVQSRADVGADDEFDSFDLGLHEHDPEVLLFRGVGVAAQQVDIAGLELKRISWGS